MFFSLICIQNFTNRKQENPFVRVCENKFSFVFISKFTKYKCIRCSIKIWQFMHNKCTRANGQRMKKSQLEGVHLSTLISFMYSWNFGRTINFALKCACAHGQRYYSISANGNGWWFAVFSLYLSKMTPMWPSIMINVHFLLHFFKCQQE